VNTEPTAERYRDNNGRMVWRIVYGEVVLQDALTSDRLVAESLAQYRRDAGRTDILADAGKHAGPAARRRRIAATLRTRENSLAVVQLVVGLVGAAALLALVLSSHH